jgi:hypothetical protein
MRIDGRRREFCAYKRVSVLTGWPPSGWQETMLNGIRGELNGRCLRAEIRERRKTARRRFRVSGPSSFQVLNYATSGFRDCRKASRGRSFGSARWTRIESHLSECLCKLGRVSLISVGPISSPNSRGFRTVKRRRFNGLGEMKSCLQSRCSRISVSCRCQANRDE